MPYTDETDIKSLGRLINFQVSSFQLNRRDHTQYTLFAIWVNYRNKYGQSQESKSLNYDDYSNCDLAVEKIIMFTLHQTFKKVKLSIKENIVLLSCKRYGRSCVTKLHCRLTSKKDERGGQKTILVYILALNMNSVEKEKLARGIPFKYYV